QDDRSHTDEATVFDDAAMQRHRVADRYPVAQDDRPFTQHAVQYRAVLDVRVCADADGMDVAADDRAHPYAGIFAQLDVADHLRRLVDVTSCSNLRQHTLVWSNHGALPQPLNISRSRVTAQQVGARWCATCKWFRHGKRPVRIRAAFRALVTDARLAPCNPADSYSGVRMSLRQRLFIRRFLFSVWLVLIVWVFAFQMRLFAQDSATGSLRGIVEDQSGARIAMARVFLTEESTGAQR